MTQTDFKITSEQVVDAFKRNGYIPVHCFEDWCDHAVALQVLAVDAGCKSIDDYVRFWTCLTGTDSEYVTAFDYGWIGHDNYSESIRSNPGYEDGMSAWQACVDAGLVEGESA